MRQCLERASDFVKSSTKATTATVYANQRLQFAITLPAGWYYPSADDHDPHFISCTEGAGYGFEIYRQPTESYASIQAYYASSTADEKRFTGLIPGAEVWEYKPESLENGEGWTYWYYILYKQEKIAFTFSSAQKIDHYPFVSTFRLLP